MSAEQKLINQITKSRVWEVIMQHEQDCLNTVLLRSFLMAQSGA
jgi:hypothetical protein